MSIAKRKANPHGRTDQDYCYPRTIGYDPAAIMAQIDGTGFSTASGDTADALTKVMILHPIACALGFIAFLLALSAGCIGSLIAAMVSAVTFLITLIVMATDFVWAGIIKNHVNSDGTGSNAYYSVAMWTILAAMIIQFFATFIVLFSCCSTRRTHRTSKIDGAYGNGGTTRRRRFW
jgi:multisubunit Na+/H+ antiporter MnhC subunit